MRSDDEVAFTSLYYRYWELLYNTAYKRLKDHELCEQIVQDVFTDLWIRRKQTIISNLPGYLRTAVQYQVYKIVTRKNTGAAFFELFEQMGSPTYHADAGIKYKEFAALIDSWMETLPAKRREIFQLHYFENLSSPEIAKRLNLSPKTVRNQLGTSLESFRIKLSQFLSVMLM
ncbi:hypothetical protein A9P82_01090 [Arachidicoccus ginsenosidimutans]|nr:hypothetical protein A9P82_01090 [Arachidicoccus sp. BS20]